jgi:hypothetical protein
MIAAQLLSVWPKKSETRGLTCYGFAVQLW